MFYLIVGALGLGLGRHFGWLILPAFGFALTMALCVEGILHGRSLGAVILSAALVVSILDVAYIIGAVTREFGLVRLRHRKA